MEPSPPPAADALRNVVREHLESVAPGAVGSVSRQALDLSPEAFAATLALLLDLERAGVLRLGTIRPNESVEFERLA